MPTLRPMIALLIDKVHSFFISIIFFQSGWKKIIDHRAARPLRRAFSTPSIYARRIHLGELLKRKWSATAQKRGFACRHNL